MADTAIQWTHQPGTVGKTWNPLGGCSDADETCANCYARSMAERIPNMARALGNSEIEVMYSGLTKRSEKRHLLQWTGVLRPFPERLVEPLKQRRPATYFVNSMSDLFHAEVPPSFLSAVYGVMAACPEHTFIVLTKRADRRRAWFESQACSPHMELAGLADQYISLAHGMSTQLAGKLYRHFDDVMGDTDLAWPLPNVWEGTSIGNRAGLWRIEELRKTPAAVRMLSIEPQIEDLGALDLTGIHWCVQGGESGRGARPFQVCWARDVRNQCAQQGTAYFLKQLGATIRVPDTEALGDVESGWSPFARTCVSDDNLVRLPDRKGGDMSEWPHDLRVRQFPEARP